MDQDFPISTGQVAKLLGVPEHRVSSQIRLGKLSPPQSMGRRAWSAEHVLTVAKLLGRDSIQIRNLCNETVADRSAVTP